jgi:hypothetical protein
LSNGPYKRHPTRRCADTRFFIREISFRRCRKLTQLESRIVEMIKQVSVLTKTGRSRNKVLRELARRKLRGNQTRSLIESWKEEPIPTNSIKENSYFLTTFFRFDERALHQEKLAACGRSFFHGTRARATITVVKFHPPDESPARASAQCRAYRCDRSPVARAHPSPRWRPPAARRWCRPRRLP